MEERIPASARFSMSASQRRTLCVLASSGRIVLPVPNMGGDFTMPHPRFQSEEIARRGEGLYEQRLRALVETEENLGKIISIDIETGDYEIDEDPLITGRRLL